METVIEYWHVRSAEMGETETDEHTRDADHMTRIVSWNVRTLAWTWETRKRYIERYMEKYGGFIPIVFDARLYQHCLTKELERTTKLAQRVADRARNTSRDESKTNGEDNRKCYICGMKG